MLKNWKTFADLVYNIKDQDEMSRYDRRSAPTVYEIRCDNGDFEDECEEPVVDCGDYYMIGSYKYANSFPKEWALSHKEGTGPEQCRNCVEVDGLFIGYCLNCAKYVYNGERGDGMDHDHCDEPCQNKVENKVERLAKFLEYARELDFAFDVVNEKVAEDDPSVLNFYGIEDA
jgi:hypothetical protein